MKKYFNIFLHRGALFAGLGPIVLGIVFAILSATIDGFSLRGTEVLMGIVSTYLLAFIQAGASVFNQIEEWSVGKSLFFHFATLFIAYSLCYIANAWIPFEPTVLLIFCLVFIIVYFVIWLTVYSIVRATSKRLNSCIG